MVDANGQAIFVGEPEIVKENLGLSAGIVENQGGFMLAYLVEHRRNRIGSPIAGPRRGRVRAQHPDVGRRAGIGQQDRAGVGVTRHEMRDGGGIFDGG